MATGPAYLDLLRKYDTPTVCNVVELFDVRPRQSGHSHTTQWVAAAVAAPPVIACAISNQRAAEIESTRRA